MANGGHRAPSAAANARESPGMIARGGHPLGAMASAGNPPRAGPARPRADRPRRGALRDDDGGELVVFRDPRGFRGPRSAESRPSAHRRPASTADSIEQGRRGTSAGAVSGPPPRGGDDHSAIAAAQPQEPLSGHNTTAASRFLVASCVGGTPRRPIGATRDAGKRKRECGTEHQPAGGYSRRVAGSCGAFRLCRAAESNAPSCRTASV